MEISFTHVVIRVCQLNRHFQRALLSFHRNLITCLPIDFRKTSKQTRTAERLISKESGLQMTMQGLIALHSGADGEKEIKDGERTRSC